MSFIELKPCDVISTTYVTSPHYRLILSGAKAVMMESDQFYIYSGSQGQTRDYFDVNDEPITGSSFSVSGAVAYITYPTLTTLEKRSFERLRQLYYSKSFKKSENYSTASLYPENYHKESVQDFCLMNIPSVLYGTEIKPGSLFVQMEDEGLDLDFRDDGYGGLILSSSAMGISGTLLGSIFYQHGVVYFSGLLAGAAAFTASFSGTNKVPVNFYNCQVPRGELNFTTNPSYKTYISSSNRNEISTKQPKTFITGIKLYDEEYNLVGYAKVSNAVLNEESTGLIFKLKLNF